MIYQKKTDINLYFINFIKTSHLSYSAAQGLHRQTDLRSGTFRFSPDAPNRRSVHLFTYLRNIGADIDCASILRRRTSQALSFTNVSR